MNGSLRRERDACGGETRPGRGRPITDQSARTITVQRKVTSSRRIGARFAHVPERRSRYMMIAGRGCRVGSAVMRGRFVILDAVEPRADLCVLYGSGRPPGVCLRC